MPEREYGLHDAAIFRESGDSVIAAALGGGVGNQLFQYATARALALRRSVPLTLDDRQYRRRSWPVYALDAFAIAAAPPAPALSGDRIEFDVPIDYTIRRNDPS